MNLPDDAPAQAITAESLDAFFDDVRKQHAYLTGGIFSRDSLKKLLKQIWEFRPVLQALLDVERAAYTFKLYDDAVQENGSTTLDWDKGTLRETCRTALRTFKHLLPALHAPFVSRYGAEPVKAPETVVKGILDGLGRDFNVLVVYEKEIDCDHDHDSHTAEETVCYPSVEEAVKDVRLRILTGSAYRAEAVWIARELSSTESAAWRALESDWKATTRAYVDAAHEYSARVKEADTLIAMVKRKRREIDARKPWSLADAPLVEQDQAAITVLEGQIAGLKTEAQAFEAKIPEDLRTKFIQRRFPST